MSCNTERSLLCLLAALAAAACTSTTGTHPAPAAQPELVRTETPESASEPRSRRHRPARVEVLDDYGFTITEEIRISGEVRAEYQNALNLLDQNQLEQGIEQLRDVTMKAPDVTAPHVNLGIAYRRHGDLELAEQSLLTALELTPKHPIAHNELGILYRETGRFAAARSSYEQALGVHPGFHYARRNLAILCDLYLADLPCALEHYELYSQEVPDDDEVAIWISDIRNRLAQ